MEYGHAECADWGQQEDKTRWQKGYGKRYPLDGSDPRAKYHKMTSKYDFVKVRVWLCGMDHYYVLSRYLISRTLTVTKIPYVKAVRITLELKKHLVDMNMLDVTQAQMEQILFRIMESRGFGAPYIGRYRMVNQFFQERRPLLILLCGAPCTGKSTLAQQLAARLNLPNVVQTDLVYQLLRSSADPPVHRLPIWLRTDLTQSELITEFRRECWVVRKGVDGEVKKALKEGKSVILEGMHVEPDLYINEVTQHVLPIAPCVQHRFPGVKGSEMLCTDRGGEGTTDRKQKKMAVDCPLMGGCQDEDAGCVQTSDQAFKTHNVESCQWGRLGAGGCSIDDMFTARRCGIEEPRVSSFCGGGTSDDNVGPTVSCSGDCESMQLTSRWANGDMVAKSRGSVERVSLWLRGIQDETGGGYIEGPGMSTQTLHQLPQPQHEWAACKGRSDIDRACSTFQSLATPPKVPVVSIQNAGCNACYNNKHQPSGCPRPLLVPIIIHMDEDDHKFLASQWFARSLLDPSADASIDFQQSFAQLRLLQEHLCQCQPPPVALLRVGIARMAEVLDTLHDHFLHCIEASMV